MRCVDVPGNLCFVMVFTVNKFSTQLFFFIFNSTLTFCTLLLRKGDKYSCITLFGVRKPLVKKKKEKKRVMYMRCYAYVVQQVQSYHEVKKIDGLRCWDTTNVNC